MRGARESSSNVCTLVSCFYAALVEAEVSNFIMGSSRAGLVSGTLGRGNFSLISLLSELGTLRVNFSQRNFTVFSDTSVSLV